MFGLFNKTKTVKYNSSNIEKDIDIFIDIFFKHIQELKDESLEEIIKNFTQTVRDEYVFIVLYKTDLNSLIDYNENADDSKKKFQVSNVEDFIHKIIVNLAKNLQGLYPDNYNENLNIITTILSNSTFEYIEYKRQQLFKLREEKDTVIDYPYFGSMYRIKSLHENIVMPKDFDFKAIHKNIFKMYEREGDHNLGIQKVQTFLGSVVEKYINDDQDKKITPELISAISYNAKNYIDRINSDYIIEKGIETNPKNTLSIDECLGQKYLPIFNAPQKVKIKGTDEYTSINKAVIVTTLETILTRYKGTIGNKVDDLGYSYSHFGNMVEVYDDDNLFKKYLILSNEEFKRFYDYVTINDKAFDEAFSPEKKKQRKLEEADIGSGEAKKDFDEIVLQAILIGATDIHLKPYEGKGLINIRTKTGIITTLDQVPKERLIRIVRMLSGDSGVNEFGIEEPQDGEQHRTVVDKKTGISYEVDLRFGFAQGLERVYIRLGSVTSNGEKKKLSLLQMGYEQDDLDVIHGMLENNSNGLILVTGPTGSGKTTLLYGILEHQIPLRDDVHLLTAEDPIERELRFKNVEQNKITEKADSKTLLKSFLRQDPDWILIGETRDKDLLSMVIEASQTGHLTFSTYHTNNTVETLERLSKMYAGDDVKTFGLARDSLLSILRGIISVILVPKLCPHCKLESNSDEVRARIKRKGFNDDRIDAMIDKNGKFYKRKPKGCNKCDSGFLGKQTINEIMNLSNKQVHDEVSDGNYSSIVKQFEKGMKYVNEGIIDIDTLSKNASK